jgi:hypothetical protein
MDSNTDQEPMNFFIVNNLKPVDAFKKGVWLLYSSMFLIIMLVLCIMRTVFMNPGYFPSPLELEDKIIKKNIKTDIFNKGKKMNDIEATIFKVDLATKYNYLTNFNSMIEDGPITFQDGINIRENISTFFPLRDENENKDLTNDEIFLLNKRNINNSNKSTESSYCYNQSSDNLYLNVYSGIDLTKTNLCGVCLRIKVERSHHCRQCGRCVLKMDHHCPWLANCIGFRNYKSFCLIHFYGLISTTLITLSYWEVVFSYHTNFDSDLFNCWYVTFIYICNIGLMIFLSWLFYVNMNLVFSGMTIIEQSDRERFPSTKAINIYNMGWRRNFVNIFGANPLVWFIPFFANYKGNGFIYETTGFSMD